ncbi:PadR family transcriptional regulator, partial [Streptomyces sp. NPDC059083]|uniref:PadR family transcriptional regulator n=1 Tax=Streptomyces sp. NPDC059083 TaxID=3346721 RepID=UPI0036A3B615
MKLELLLLGVLGMVPATGYDLKKFFDTHGRFMRSNTQMSQVYRALSRLADEGLVTYEVQERPGPQDAKTYHLTAEGMTVFLDWLTGPYNPPTKFTDPEFLARMSFSGFMTREQLTGVPADLGLRMHPAPDELEVRVQLDLADRGLAKPTGGPLDHSQRHA